MRDESGSVRRPAVEGGHTPVLVAETLEVLNLEAGMTVVDATVGLGGLAAELAREIGEGGRLIAIDRDPEMLERARERLSEHSNVELYQSAFSQLERVLEQAGVTGVDGIVYDLGLNSVQLADPERGFSFRGTGSLDMRYDRSEPLTAGELINTAEELALADLIYRYGGERASRRIARAIVRSRPILDTASLVRVIERAAPRRGKIHPATRTFQALRIVVNRELAELEEALSAAERILGPGGIAAVISFHSLEDGIVKKFFREGERDGRWERITAKPMRPTQEETAANPRARSARLRAARRT